MVGASVGSVALAAGTALIASIPGDHRAAVLSAFYVAVYGALSIPAGLAGIVVSHLGLDATFEFFGSVVAGIALIVAFEAWRTRPTHHHGWTLDLEAELPGHRLAIPGLGEKSWTPAFRAAREHRAGGAFVHHPHKLSAWPCGFRVRPTGEAST